MFLIMLKSNHIKIFKKIAIIIFLFICIFIVLWYWTKNINQNLHKDYHFSFSQQIRDRNNVIINVIQNNKGNYLIPTKDIPKNFSLLLIQKEDIYFYKHFGFNPFRIIKTFGEIILRQKVTPSSTITQQLVKILFNNENDRNFINKTKETLAAIALELHTNKSEILEMYINSIYFGNHTQGINTASQLYFGKSAKMLTKQEQLQLIATISSPSFSNPFQKKNIIETQKWANFFDIKIDNLVFFSKKIIANKKNQFFINFIKQSWFEVQNFITLSEYSPNIKLTIDNNLTQNIRNILYNSLQTLAEKKVQNGAIIIIKLPENELLAIVGSPNPTKQKNGYQINLATTPRSIGSTIKPFIVTYSFSKKIRPYTLIKDQEYKYQVADGSAFYPKNYDFKYYGIVNIHYALSNSLNVPMLKILEYIGIEKFSKFLAEELQIKPLRNWNEYQFGIATGRVEISLLQLSYLFSLFANQGKLTPFVLNFSHDINKYKNDDNQFYEKDQNSIKKYINIPNYLSINKQIFDPKHVQLINAILVDRETGTDQFSLLNNLRIKNQSIAVKTGTSVAFRDSWTIGYSPDFLVGVWLGNADNHSMDKISGQIGAGQIWRDVIYLLLNSKYHKKNNFNFSQIKYFCNDDKSCQYGLKSDDFKKSEFALLSNDSIIISPHNNDRFLLENKTKILLLSENNVQWWVNKKNLGTGKEIFFSPKKKGLFVLKAKFLEKTKYINFYVD